MADIQAIANDLSKLTVLQVAELVKVLEEKWGVSAAAAAPGMVAAGGVPAAGGAGAAGGPPPARHWRGRSPGGRVSFPGDALLEGAGDRGEDAVRRRGRTCGERG